MNKFLRTAELLSGARKEAGMSQKKIAYRMGLSSHQFVSNIERARCTVPKKKIKQVADAYEVDVSKIRQSMVFDYAEGIGATVAGTVALASIKREGEE